MKAIRKEKNNWMVKKVGKWREDGNGGSTLITFLRMENKGWMDERRGMRGRRWQRVKKERGGGAVCEVINCKTVVDKERK